MNKMTKFAAGLALATVVGLSTSASASGGKHRGSFGSPFAHPEKMAMIAEKLELTSEQRDRIEDRMNQARRDARDHRDGLRQVRRALREQRKSGVFDEAAVRSLARERAGHMEELMVVYGQASADVRAMLTPEQQSALSELRLRKRRGRE